MQENNPALDQSNGGKSDFELRLHCLSLAAGLGMVQGNEADFVTEWAREFYLFLSSKDPVIDVKIVGSDNVISMAEYLSGNAGRVVAPVDVDDTH